MANDLNLCQFIGRLGADPETRYMQSGDQVTNFRLACGWKTSEKEGVEWIRITAFSKLAEICGEYLRKGSQVYVSGRIQTRKWTDKDGQERYTTEVVADRMQMLGSKRDAEQSAPREPAATQPAKTPAPKSAGGVAEMDDDIPF